MYLMNLEYVFRTILMLWDVCKIGSVSNAFGYVSMMEHINKEDECYIICW